VYIYTAHIISYKLECLKPYPALHDSKHFLYVYLACPFSLII
jgi:hypothetical protein